MPCAPVSLQHSPGAASVDPAVRQHRDSAQHLSRATRGRYHLS
ncbi:hypothetical protein E2C01_042382 [Portunus trituberculatus]|uniref:Uncharacterized protein n=1 Tax=Portunus trituberculatus TaxID=210409 RepID=A0A5B7FTH2_PORTR|nr:hypothetical protein [Portunus trituberculatus]